MPDKRRVVAYPPQEIADEHTLVAQKYAGYFVGHPYRNHQQTRIVEVDTSRPWEEPGVVADDCIFCQRLTDEDVERRILGYQNALDREAIRTYSNQYNWWVSHGGDVPEPGELNSPKNRRVFVDYMFRNNLQDAAVPMIDLPFRLKRKLCIEWNHVLLRWMEENGVEYDFDRREFYRLEDVPENRPIEQPVDESICDFDPYLGC